MTIFSGILAFIKLIVEIWPYFKDAITESPEEFAASLHEVIAKLKQVKKDAPLPERKAAAKKAARDFADHIKRL